MTKNDVTKFFLASALFFVWVTVQGAIQAQEKVHEFLELPTGSIIVGAHVHIGTLGWIGLTIMGLLYYLVPKLVDKPLSWPKLVNWIFWIDVIVIPLNAILMIMAGYSGVNAYLSGVGPEELEAVIGPYMMGIGILSLICGLVSVLFAIQILHTAFKK
jgi:cytochrome c oxidase cbb3-type subunit 1